MTPIEKLARPSEVDGARPRRTMCCERCAWGSGPHTCSPSPMDAALSSTGNAVLVERERCARLVERLWNTFLPIPRNNLEWSKMIAELAYNIRRGPG